MKLLRILLEVLAVSAAIFLASLQTARADQDLVLGVQTWTLRNLNFDQMVDFAVKHKLKNIELSTKHITANAPWDEIKKKKTAFEKNGLVPYSYGVAATSLNRRCAAD